MSWFDFNKEKKLNPLEAYNLWARSYGNESNPIKNLSDELITRWMPNIEGMTVLDAGCGVGKVCQLAAVLGASQITGVDFSLPMVEEARKNCPKAEIKQVDLSITKIKGHYDYAICALVLGHISNLDFALHNLIDNLAPDGVLLITDFHPYLTLQGGKRTFTEQNSKRVYEVDHYLHLFEEYFKIIRESNANVVDFAERLWQGQPVVFGMKIQKNKTVGSAS
jgi:malonyl-CoA O-methyltransferase